MKELVRSVPLILFLSILFVLSISIYVGNMQIHESMDGISNVDTPPPDDSDTTISNEITITNAEQKYVDDLNTISSYINTQLSDSSNNVNVPTEITTPPSNNVNVPTEITTPPSNSVNVPPPSSVDWFTYWNYVASSSDPTAYSSSNLISKTQIVPPVCPQCPQTAGIGACTNCGGLGGSGTSSKYKNKFTDFLSTYGSGYKGNGKWAGITNNKRTSQYQYQYNDAGNYAGNENGFGRVVENEGSGTVGLLRDTGSGTVGLLRDTGSGATELLRDGTSGAVGLLRDVGSGAVGLLKSNPTQLGQINNNSGQQYGSNGLSQSMGQGQSMSQGQNYGTMSNNPASKMQGIDPYSYNGALVSKGSNYIPVTNDFSAFRK